MCINEVLPVQTPAKIPSRQVYKVPNSAADKAEKTKAKT